MGIETLKPETETRPEREAGVVGLPHAGSLSFGSCDKVGLRTTRDTSRFRRITKTGEACAAHRYRHVRALTMGAKRRRSPLAIE